MVPRLSAIDFKAACALLDAGANRGTGFLVSAELLLTCHHVIKDVGDGLVRATFPHGQYDATVELVDAPNDCALLLLKRPVPANDAHPLVLSSSPIQKSVVWEGYGFPAAIGQAGLLIGGRVQDPAGQDSSLRPAVVLQSANVTAGSWLAGFSGSPVLINSKVIGQMRRIIADESGGAQMAVVYACPASILTMLTQRRLDSAFPSSNPYRGLAAFQPEDEHFFFGREKLVEKLCQRFNALYESPGRQRILAVLGPSGSGKSSVVLAGLVPALRALPVPGPMPPRVIFFKPGDRPIENLARALVPLLRAGSIDLPANQQVAIEKLLRSQEVPAEGLRRFVADLPDIATMPLIVIVDQFEEIYTLCTNNAERDAFVGLLLHAASDCAGGVAVVMTLRSDFLGETQRHHPEVNRLIMEQEVLVGAMSPQEVRQAIARPAEEAGRPIDGATVALLAEASASEGALPLLEFSLTRIWEEMANGKAPIAALQEIGGVGGALAGKAQQIFGALNSAEKETARRAFVRLVNLGEGTRDTRRRVALRELCGRGETVASVLSVLRKFSAENARLITLSGDDAETVAEVTHEAIFDHWTELRSWINESRTDRRFHDRVSQAAQLWSEAGRSIGRLWRPPDLNLLRNYQQRRPQELSDLQEAFLVAAERRQRLDKWIRVMGALSVVAAVFLAATIYIAKERQRTWEVHEKLLDAYVERGRQLLFTDGKPSMGLLWLHRALVEGSKDPALPDLLKSAMQSVDATHVVLIGHKHGVYCASFSPDGHRVVTASFDNTARVWDAETGQLLTMLSGRAVKLDCAQFSPDGSRIVSVGFDNTARVWDAETGRLRTELKGHESVVESARYSPDGRLIVTASRDHTARVWDADDGRLLVELKGHTDRVSSAVFSPDSRQIVTASWDRTARIWNAESGRSIAVLKGHLDKVNSALFSPDGRRIITASWDHTVQVWDANSGQLVAGPKGHRDFVMSAEFSPDGKRAFTIDGNQTVRIFATDDWRLLAELKGHGAYVASATFSPDGQRIVTASGDHTARIWDVSGGHLLAELRGHGDRVNSATFSPDGRRIITTSWDFTARVWVANSRRFMAELKGHEDRVNSAAFSPDGRLIITSSGDHTARVWDTNGGYLLIELKGHRDSVNNAKFSPDGRRIVTSSRDHTARVWDTENGHLVAELKGHADSVESATFALDSRRVVTSSKDHTVRVWNADDGRVLREFKGDLDFDYAMYSPDGQRIVTRNSNQKPQIWDVDGGRLLAELKYGALISGTMFSPDSRRIITSGFDNRASVWAADGGRPLAELKGHGAFIQRAMFSPDGRRIITASADNTALIWEADSGRITAELAGSGDSVKNTTFSPDGLRIATAGADNTARIFEADRGRLIAELRGHGDIVNSANFSPNGQRIVTASDDNTARVWDLSSETRTNSQLATLIRCHVPARFEREGSNTIVFTAPNPADCQRLR